MHSWRLYTTRTGRYAEIMPGVCRKRQVGSPPHEGKYLPIHIVSRVFYIVGQTHIFERKYSTRMAADISAKCCSRCRLRSRPVVYIIIIIHRICKNTRNCTIPCTVYYYIGIYETYYIMHCAAVMCKSGRAAVCFNVAKPMKQSYADVYYTI